MKVVLKLCMNFKKMTTRDRLTIEESQELINLGIPWHYATIIRTEVPARVVGFRDEYVFTLTNLLDLIPKVIKIKDRWAFFILQGLPGDLKEDEDKDEPEDKALEEYCEGKNSGFWISGYSDGGGYIRNNFPIFAAFQPIEAIFKLVKWCLMLGYIKFDKE